MSQVSAQLSPTRQRSRERRLKRILLEAMSLILDGDVDTFSMHQLAKRLDYTVGALYRYFPSRDALIAQLQIQAIETVQAWLEKTGELCDSALAETDATQAGASLFRLLAPTQLYGAIAEDAPAEFRLMTSLLMNPREVIDDDSASRAARSAVPLARIIEGLFAEAAQVGALDSGDSTERAVIFWSGLQGVMQLRKMRRLRPDVIEIERLTAQFCASMLRGWGAATTDMAEADRLLRIHDHHAALVLSANPDKAQADDDP